MDQVTAMLAGFSLFTMMIVIHGIERINANKPKKKENPDAVDKAYLENHRFYKLRNGCLNLILPMSIGNHQTKEMVSNADTNVG